MIKLDALSMVDFESLKLTEAQHCIVEGWLIGFETLTLVDDPDRPVFKLSMPDYVYKVLTSTLPGRVRVGGRYIIEEQVRVSGNLFCHEDKMEFRSIDTVELCEVGKTLNFTS